jgi:uncharacterized membrane protein YkvA (DUF1232 family)
MSFFDTVGTLLKVGGAVTALLLLLLALPQSKLRDFALPIIAWVFTAACGIYVISPLDAIPDVVPVLGWIDDIGVAAAGIASAVTALTYKRS